MTQLDWQEVTRAAQIIRAGGLVAIPTETVYGLGGDATNDRAVAEIYAAKGRPAFNPLIIHVADLEMARTCGVIDALAERLIRTFWPGPLTLVVARRPASDISLLASAGLGTIALRSPDHLVAQALINTVKRPLAAPSANPSGTISPTTPDHVRRALGDKVAMVLEGGACRIGLESTIVKIADGKATLLRPGGLSRHRIETCIAQPLLIPAAQSPIEAPGNLTSHYAPEAPLRINVTGPGTNEAFLGFGPGSGAMPPHSLNLSPSGDLTEAAANLFAMLHQLDDWCREMQLAGIGVAPIPADGLGEAINDRLHRAAAPR